MPGLRWPMAGSLPVRQEFDGAFDGEPEGFIAFDSSGRPRRARKKSFTGSQFRNHLHGGVDISCGVGTVIRAPERGTIVRADHYDVKGKKEIYLMLQIKPGTVLFFTHLSDNRIVPVGRPVGRGEPIALSGNSGMSTGPHLHYEVRVTSRRNPRPEKSGRWFKLDPQRVRVGGDLATLGVIKPPPPIGGVVVPPPVIDADDPAPDEGPAGAPPTDPGAPVDIDLEDGADRDEDTDPDDTIGDAAFAAAVEAGEVDPVGLPHLGGPHGHA